MAQFIFKCNLTDKNGNPLIGVEVEAIDVNLFTTSARDPIQHVVATATTDNSGTATFTGLNPGMYYARPRLSRPDIRVQVMIPSGSGGGGKMCYSALVHPTAGIGTHTTIQGALDDLGDVDQTIFVCGGTYQENVKVSVSGTSDITIIGASSLETIIEGQGTDYTVQVSGATGGLRLEHMTLTHVGAYSLFRINVAGSPNQSRDFWFNDVLFLSGQAAFDFDSVQVGLRWHLQDVRVTTTDAGEIIADNLVMNNCRFEVTGIGLIIGSGSATYESTEVRISNSHFKGGSTHALYLNFVEDLKMSSCHVNATGAGVPGILLNDVETATLGQVHIHCADGRGIDGGAQSGDHMVIDGCVLECDSGQAVARVGIYLTPSQHPVIISDCQISGFESYGIHLYHASGTTIDTAIIGNIITNGADISSIYIDNCNDITIVGNILIGTGGGGTTYGIEGANTPNNIVIVANRARNHDDLTNLVNGVNSVIVVGNSPAGPGGVTSSSLIIDLDGDTKVDVEESADEDKIRMVVAGNERFLLQDSSPYCTITGDTLIEVAAGGGPTPDCLLHIWKASGGTVTPLSPNTILAVESSADMAITLISPKGNKRSIYFADDTATVGPYAGYIEYYGADDTPSQSMGFGLAGGRRLIYGVGAFAFQEATTISTTTGNLILNPAGYVELEDTKAINTGNSDDDYFTLGAVDNDDQSLVECLRLVGAAEPHVLLTRAKFSTSSHAADVGHRGFLYFTEGGAGVADKLYCIMKGTDDSYGAIQVAIG